jgi:signal transduction histidine kinase
VTFTVMISIIVCRFSPNLSTLEFALLDSLFVLRPARTPDPRIALIGIEKTAIDQHEENRDVDCACSLVPRNKIGRELSRVKQAGAKVTVLDLVLERTCPVKVPEEHDQPLVQALREPGEVILTAKTISNPDKIYFRDPAAEFMWAQEQSHRIIGSPVLYSPRGTIRGVSLIQKGDPSESERKRLEPLECVGRTLPPLAVAGYCAFMEEPCEAVQEDTTDCAARGAGIPVWPSTTIYLLEPLMSEVADSSHVMLINWAGPAGTFPMYSFSAIQNASNVQLRSWFEDKLVFVGSGAETEYTPMRGTPAKVSWPYVDQSGEKAMTGVEVHANVADTIMQRRFLRPLPLPLIWILMVGCSLVVALAFQRLSTWVATGMVIVEVGLIFLAAVLLMRWDYWLYVVIPVTAVATTGVVSGLWGYACSRHEASRLAREAEVRDAATQALVHDLKQPLAAISGLAAAIRIMEQADTADEEALELVQRIQGQVERAVEDIDELLMASPDRDLPLEYRPFDVASLAADLAVTQSLKSTVHDFQVQAPAGGAVISADPRLVGRAIANLMDNAIKYWPAGGTIIVRIEKEPGDRIGIRIIDRGVGMTREQQSRVFERFERAVPEGSAIPGTGIGLYSVRKIAQAHGGSVSVTSEPGAGSTFILRLPVEPPPQAVKERTVR